MKVFKKKFEYFEGNANRNFKDSQHNFYDHAEYVANTCCFVRRNYMNDSLRTEVFLQYSPETVACACIYLTARKLKIVLPKVPAPWFNLFGVEEKDILDICRRIVKLYKRPKVIHQIKFTC